MQPKYCSTGTAPTCNSITFSINVTIPILAGIEVGKKEQKKE